MESNLTDETRSFWSCVLKKDQLLYPSEFVVRFLARFGCQSDCKNKALDIGFGSGRHLKILLDKGYFTSGVELIPEAHAAASCVFSGSQGLDRLWVGDFRKLPLPEWTFDVIICLGSLIIRKEYLIRLYNLLRPGGGILLNYRTPFSWFAGLGKEISPSFFHLDERAREYTGSFYYFPSQEALTKQIKQAGFECENFERYDWRKKDATELHSWWVFWLASKGD
jgi:hypothetical protein